MWDASGVSISIQSVLRQLRAAFRPADLKTSSLLMAAFLTVVVSVVAWRVAVLLGSPLALAALFAAPVVVGARSVTLALASLMAVIVVAIALLPGIASGGQAHTAAFMFSGAAIIVAFMYAGLAAGSRLGEARFALGQMRIKAQRTHSALSRAGICVVALNKKLSWAEANDAAWGAFGCDPRVTRATDGRMEIDDEAASALMHSSSRESWRRLLEQVKADLTYRAWHSKEAHGLRPYETVLYSITGEPTTFRFTVTISERGELTFIGTPVRAQAGEKDHVIQKWLTDVVESIDEPAVALQSDGLVIAANREFQEYAGKLEPGMRLFDFPSVTGVSEGNFTARVWSPTRLGATSLPLLELQGAGEGLGARLVPPGAPHLETVLLLFRSVEAPVPSAFSEHTQPADLDS